MPYIPRITGFTDGTVRFRGDLGEACRNLDYLYEPTKPNLTDTVFLPEAKLEEGPKPPKDHDKWSQIKRSGLIKMTPLERSRTSTKYFAVGAREYSFSLGHPSCLSYNPPLYGPEIKATSSWTRWYTSSDLYNDLTSPVTNGVVPDIQHELNSLMSQVVSANLMTYDILTDLGESYKTLQMIIELVKKARHPLQTFRDYLDRRERAQRRHARNVDREQFAEQDFDMKALGAQWMQVRYGIMPLVYSIKDLIELIKDKDDTYKTDRAQREFRYSTGGSSNPSAVGVYSYTQEDVVVTIGAVAKARYAPDEYSLRLLDQISINPFITAWEMIPFSFVVDWFANVGDWILSQTSLLTDGATQRVLCKTVKEKRTKSTWIQVNKSYTARREYPDHAVVAGPIPVQLNGLLSVKQTETYSRTLFIPSDVDLQFDVLLNWKRGVDAWVMIQNPLITALRKLNR